MKPADRVALLTALIAGAEAELKRAKEAALAVADEVGVKSFTTPFGSVTVGQREAAPAVTDPKALLAWVREAYSTEVEVVAQVRTSFVTALLGRVEWAPDIGEFVDPVSGEAVPGVEWTEPGAPYITWPSGTEQKATKAEAAQWFEGRSEELLGAMRQIGAST